MKHVGIFGINFFRKKLYEAEQRQLKKQREELKKLKEKYLEAIDQNKKYKSWYGTLVSPRAIIMEFWNNDTVGKYGLLIPPSRWNLKLSGENGKRAKRFWINKLLDMKLIKYWGKGKYTSETSNMKEALDIVHSALVAEGLIKIGEDIEG